MIRIRSAALALGAAILGTVTVSTPAWADVTITPELAQQGDGVRVTFRVSNDRPEAYTTKVEVQLPQDTPIAEIFPLSVPDWAPALTMRKLDTPLESIHGSPTYEVVTTITWIAVGDGAKKPGVAQELPTTMGPLPATEQVAFVVVQTYSDGTVVRWDEARTGDAIAQHPAPVLKLAPVQDIPAADAATEEESGGGNVAAWLAGAGLLAGVVLGLLLSARSRDRDEDPSGTAGTDGVAGSGHAGRPEQSKWALDPAELAGPAGTGGGDAAEKAAARPS